MKSLAIAAFMFVLSAVTALADSCWWHNGSLMRLQAYGNERYFYYEEPRQALWNSGVRRGTLLFNGTNNGGWYSGLSRVFSSSCPGQPLEYWVEGPVGNGQTKVTMHGTRERNRNCYGTGQMTTDTLVFTYAHQC